MKKNIRKIMPVAMAISMVMTSSVFAQEGVVVPEGDDVAITGTTDVAEQTELTKIEPATKIEASNSIYIDGVKMEGISLIKEGDKFNFPVRAVFEKLGYVVDYKPATKEITIAKGPHYIMFSTTKDSYSFLRMPVRALGQMPIVKDSVTYVPFTLLTDVMNMPNVSIYENENGMANIYIGTEKAQEQTDNTQEEGNIQKVEELKPQYVEVLSIDKENNTVTVLDEKGMEIVLLLGEVDVEYTTDDKELIAGQTLEVKLSPAMTMSIPPMNNPEYVKVIYKPNINVITTIIDDISTDEKGNTLVTVNNEKLGDIVLVLGKDFKVDFSKSDKTSLEIGQAIKVGLSPIMTASIPPMNNPEYIIALEPKIPTITGNATITSVDEENEQITVEDEKLGTVILNIGSPELEVEIKDGVGLNMVNWVKEGQKLEIEYSPMMTRSAPPINTPIKITVIVNE